MSRGCHNRSECNGFHERRIHRSQDRCALQSQCQTSVLTNRNARVYVVGCSGDDGNVPAFVASFDTRISSKGMSFGFALLLCIVSYCMAVLATYYIRKSQRMTGKPGENHPNTGTNYASWQRHFDP